MAITVSFLATCRTQIVASAEKTAFDAAAAAFGSAAIADRTRYWQAAYGDNQIGLSPAYRLRKFIRDTVQSNADATVSPTERETAYQTLVNEIVPDVAKPLGIAEEAAQLRDAFFEDQVSVP